MKWTKTIVGAVLALLLLVVAQGWLTSSDLTTQVNGLQRERTQLLEHVKRLSASRRVAQVTVLEQIRNDSGQPRTRLLWQEIGRDGLISEPAEVEVVGTMVYFEAYVVKFDHGLVAGADADRGTSLAMFRRIFGDGQAPDTADSLNRVGAGWLTSPDDSSSGESALWSRFWELVESPVLAGEYGIRVAQCEAPAVRMKTGQVWEVTLDAPGGLNLKIVRDPNHVADSSPPRQ